MSAEPAELQACWMGSTAGVHEPRQVAVPMATILTAAHVNFGGGAQNVSQFARGCYSLRFMTCKPIPACHAGPLKSFCSDRSLLDR